MSRCNGGELVYGWSWKGELKLGERGSRNQGGVSQQNVGTSSQFILEGLRSSFNQSTGHPHLPPNTSKTLREAPSTPSLLGNLFIVSHLWCLKAFISFERSPPCSTVPLQCSRGCRPSPCAAASWPASPPLPPNHTSEVPPPLWCSHLICDSSGNHGLAGMPPFEEMLYPRGHYFLRARRFVVWRYISGYRQGGRQTLVRGSWSRRGLLL